MVAGCDHLEENGEELLEASLMSRDPIVDEVRAVRAAIAAERGNDLERIIAALRRKEGA